MKNFDELMSSINEKAEMKTIRIKKQRRLFLFSALCICFCAVIAIRAFISETEDAPLNIASLENNNTSLCGLKVDNFKLSEIQLNNSQYDRIAATKLSDFFSYNYSPDMFAFVRILDTKQYEGKSYHDSLRQDSSAQVISTVWSKDENIPQTLIISQSLFGGCIGNEKTNLLRENGVYLLPLVKDEANENWHICFDLDVLFEVDNEEKLWSHSKFEKLCIYDGEDVSVLSSEIIKMTSSENFDSAISPLGIIIRSWGDTGVLAEVRIETVTDENDKYDNKCCRYTFSEFKSLAETGKQNSGAVSYSDSNIQLEADAEYLIMLDYSEDGPYIENRQVAKLNSDGTITPINDDGYNFFAQLSGYTIEQIKQQVNSAQLWQKDFGDK